MNLLDLPIYQSFVQPFFCKRLIEAGLTAQTPYYYKIVNGRAELFTYSFDKDDYYADGDRLAQAALPPAEIIPAYQVKDVEKILPEFLLSRGEQGYELSLHQLYPLPTLKAERMPDVFALMALEAIRKGCISVKVSNSLISANA